ncbi:putative transporter [Proteus hauseri ATCC 700826]|uniref:Transporter n=1 Tax=Proteus hauseri ATCC 700826 TaxID=1354271 RepID=A0AAJ3LTV5_PROHU|nr:putative transporter [Proteus hauseri ATCC 700826]
MSQALSPFSQRAGLASSVLAIAQLSFASLYIWIMGWIGIPAITMLIIILLASSVIGFTLLRFFSSLNQSQEVVSNA